MENAEDELRRFIDRYSPDVALRAKAALANLEEILPGATRLVYDNYNALAIAFSPDGRLSHAILSLTLYPRWVSLFFTNGASLSDPSVLLKGAGKKMRHLVLDSTDSLERLEVQSLVSDAVRSSDIQMPQHGGHTIIRSISPNQRQRCSL